MTRRDHLEMKGARASGEALVIRDERGQVVADGEGRGDVHGVEGPQLRRSEISRGFQNLVVDPDEGDPGEDFGGAPVISRRGPPSAERSEHFDACGRTRGAFRISAQGPGQSRVSLPSTRA